MGETQGWAWDGSASPNDFCPRDLSPKAQNPGTVSAIFLPVSSVPRESVSIPVPSPGICVPGNKSHWIQVPLPIPDRHVNIAFPVLCRTLKMRLK